MHKKLKEVIICSVLAVIIGLMLGFLSGLFGRALSAIEGFRDDHYIWLLPFLGLAGVLILYMYKHISPNSEQGLDLAIAYNMGEVGEHGKIENVGHAQKIGEYPNAYVLLRLLANAIMLLFGASTGKEGTVATCGAAVGDYVSRLFRSRQYARTLLIAGVSAAVSGLFQTPLGGTFFALEFSAAGLLYYQALIPALIASYTAYYFSTICAYHAFHHAIVLTWTPDTVQILFILLSAVIFGLVGRAFAIGLHSAKRIYKKKVKNRYLGILIFGTIIAALLIFIHAGRYSGTGGSLIGGLFADHSFNIYDFALKFIFTILCITIGFSGGEMLPIMSIGATIGATLSMLFGLPFELSVVIGCTAVYSSATNTLFAPIFIGIEMFGTDAALYIAAACIIAFAINGNHSVYNRQVHTTRSIYGILRHNE